MNHAAAARRTIGLVLVAAGVIALLAGWLALRDASFLADQVSYVVSAGIGGVAMVSTGLALVASANARDEVTGRLERIETVIRSQRGEERL
jgi:hypothetical protein